MLTVYWTIEECDHQGDTRLVSSAAGPQHSIDSSISFLVTGLSRFKGGSMMLELDVEVRVPPTWPLACACVFDLLSGSLGSIIAVRVRSWKQKNRMLIRVIPYVMFIPSESMSNSFPEPILTK